MVGSLAGKRAGGAEGRQNPRARIVPLPVVQAPGRSGKCVGVGRIQRHGIRELHMGRPGTFGCCYASACELERSAGRPVVAVQRCSMPTCASFTVTACPAPRRQPGMLQSALPVGWCLACCRVRYQMYDAQYLGEGPERLIPKHHHQVSQGGGVVAAQQPRHPVVCKHACSTGSRGASRQVLGWCSVLW